MRIAIDNRDVGQCFTTWENYYRTAPEQAPPPNINTPADINSLQFRSSVPGPPALATSGGYLFDNVSITPTNGPGPPGCSGGGEVPPPDIDIDKETQTQFARPGDLVTYRITVRNRGNAPVRSLRACDQVPRALRFVRARARLQRTAGRRLCLTIRLLRPGHRRTFRATFRVRANVTADAITNGATVDVPIGSAPSPRRPAPPRRRLPEQRRRRVARDAETIGYPPTRSLRGGAESPRPRSLLEMRPAAAGGLPVARRLRQSGLGWPLGGPPRPCERSLAREMDDGGRAASSRTDPENDEAPPMRGSRKMGAAGFEPATSRV